MPDRSLLRQSKYACDECCDSGVRKIVDGDGNKIWADCPYCDMAERSRREASDAVYGERNAVVVAFARLAHEQGWPVAKTVDEQEPAWPVLLIDTPYGQVSWHLKAEQMPHWVPPAKGWGWDGHTTPEKYERLKRLADVEVSTR